MRRYPPVVVVLAAAGVVAALGITANAAAPPAAPHTAQPPPAAPRAPTPHDRAVAIVARLTLDEKIGQLAGIRTSTEFRTVPAVPRLGGEITH